MKQAILIILSLLLLTACINQNKEITRDADFEGMRNTSDFEENMVFIYVDDNLTPRERQFLRQPEYIYGYWVVITDDTVMIDEEGEEMTLEQIPISHNKVWVKEKFVEGRTYIDVNTDITTGDNNTFPIYTAEKIKSVTLERTKEMAIEQLKAYAEGEYTVHAFFEGVTSEEGLFSLDEKEGNKFRVIMGKYDNIIEYSSITAGVEEAPHNAGLLGIDKSPGYVIFDTEGIVLITYELAEVSSFLAKE